MAGGHDGNSSVQNGRKAEVKFPARLHYMLNELEKDGMSDIISWGPDGTAFKVHNKKRLEKEVLPLWFRQTHYHSFLRQLNNYGFKKIRRGVNKGMYSHKLRLFDKSRSDLSELIDRDVPMKNEASQQQRRPPDFPTRMVANNPPPASLPLQSSNAAQLFFSQSMNLPLPASPPTLSSAAAAGTSSSLASILSNNNAAAAAAGMQVNNSNRIAPTSMSNSNVATTTRSVPMMIQQQQQQQQQRGQFTAATPSSRPGPFTMEDIIRAQIMNEMMMQRLRNTTNADAAVAPAPASSRQQCHQLQGNNCNPKSPEGQPPITPYQALSSVAIQHLLRRQQQRDN